MAHLIDKDPLVAEIEKCKKDIPAGCTWGDQIEEGSRIGQEEAYDRVLRLLNTLEVKEVDLDFTKEVDSWIKDNEDTNGFFNTEELAKHFFELGLKATNPITSADRGTAEEIIINLKKIESDYNVCLTKEIEWVRKQVGQPELKTKQG